MVFKYEIGMATCLLAMALIAVHLFNTVDEFYRDCREQGGDPTTILTTIYCLNLPMPTWEPPAPHWQYDWESMICKEAL